MTTLAELDIQLKPMIADDLPFVMDSWLRSYETSNGTRLSGIDAARYYRSQRAVTDRALESSVCMMAKREVPSLIPGTEPSTWQLIGWVCYSLDHGTLHYVYVKNIFRGHDVATLLVEHALAGAKRVTYTHETNQWRGLLKNLARIHPEVEFANQNGKVYRERKGREAAGAGEPSEAGSVAGGTGEAA